MTLSEFLTLGAWIGIAVALLALAIVAVLAHIQDRREARQHDKWMARLRDMAEADVSNRPRVPAPGPLPSLNPSKGSQ
jgi:hypothetical protein